MSDWVHCWMGLTTDHLYETCPIRIRSLPELRRYDWDHQCSMPVNPIGTDICGWCVRVWKARNRGAA
jgi:hypothetical protein